MRRLLTAGLLAVASLASAAPLADASRIPVMTRLVKQFHELETRLDVATRDHDATELNALLSDDFELRDAHAPGTPVPRGLWLTQPVAATPLKIEQLAVHDRGDMAVASFLEHGAKQAWFVVDLWSRTAAGWQLTVRYRAQVETSPSPLDLSGTRPGGFDLNPRPAPARP